MGLNNLRFIKDLALASYLKEEGFELSDFYREDGIVYFGFEPHPDLNNKIKEFKCGTARGNIPEFYQYLRQLKEIIFGEG